MQLVDTNVLAYLLIEGDRTRGAQALFALDSDWSSDSFILVEFANIVCTYTRARALTVVQGKALLARATTLLPMLPAVDHAVAFEVAVEYGLSAYDARFIALAKQAKDRLVTEDKRLQLAVPEWTVSLAQAIG